MPVIVVDEQNYNTRNPDSIFSAFKTGQINPSDQLSLSVSATVNTQFGQLKTNDSSNLYAVHLRAGQSYVFTMTHKPGANGNDALITRLALEDAQFNTVVIADRQNGDSRLDFVAFKDGDYYLNANGTIEKPDSDVCRTPILTASQGKYAISAVEIPHNAYAIGATVNGSFDGTTNHVGYKVSLNAGDYVSFSFTTDGWPNVSIADVQGVKVDAATRSDKKQNDYFFM
ncbi:MAG: hypothetical protein EBV06_12045, partial [Planctomycetia bacterium]|nr:hypothetical protein [Planctomycetia bacterium]